MQLVCKKKKSHIYVAKCLVSTKSSHKNSDPHKL